jgi:hypothetical protein
MTKVAEALSRRFLDRLAASPRGRAFLLQFLVSAEEADEVGVFDELLGRIEDPELHRVAKRHRDDEERHGLLFRECVARQGVDPADIPTAPNVIAFIDHELGGFGAKFVEGRRTVMEAYLLLQVIEERGVTTYPLFANALDPYDAASAAVVRSIARDEERHVMYAKAVSKRYAPNPGALESTLRSFREAEARAFDRHGRAFLACAVDTRVLDVGALERIGWRMLVALGGRPQIPEPEKPAVVAANRAASFT